MKYFEVPGRPPLGENDVVLLANQEPGGIRSVPYPDNIKAGQDLAKAGQLHIAKRHTLLRAERVPLTVSEYVFPVGAWKGIRWRGQEQNATLCTLRDGDSNVFRLLMSTAKEVEGEGLDLGSPAKVSEGFLHLTHARVNTDSSHLRVHAYHRSVFAMEDGKGNHLVGVFAKEEAGRPDPASFEAAVLIPSGSFRMLYRPANDCARGGSSECLP